MTCFFFIELVSLVVGSRLHNSKGTIRDGLLSRCACVHVMHIRSVLARNPAPRVRINMGVLRISCKVVARNPTMLPESTIVSARTLLLLFLTIRTSAQSDEGNPSKEQL